MIDVGGGDSRLVDALLDWPVEHVTVLDISRAALTHAKRRLGARADTVTWIEADITRVVLPASAFTLWHDRAVFHFLTEAEDRQRYVDVAWQSLVPGGHLIVATFAAGGPPRCSALDVVRYAPDALAAAFGNGFTPLTHRSDVH